MRHISAQPTHPTARKAARPFGALVLSLFALLLMVLAACGPTTQASGGSGGGAGPSNAAAHLPDVTITAHDFSFDLPATIPAGLVHITFVNQGDDVHQVQFFRLLPSVTAAQFITALKAGGPASTRTLGVPAGGVDEAAPGLSSQVIAQLPAGDYVATCLVFDPKMHMFHYQMGMVGEVAVAASSSSVSAPLPANDGTITLINMSVILPPNINKPGLRTYQVINDGPGVHALDILRLAPGKTAQDVQTYLSSPSGPPPFTLLGGVGGITPGTQGWIITNLQPGDYVAACLVVDPVSHLPHAAMGMLAGFSVP